MGLSTGAKVGAAIAGVIIVLLAIGAFTVPLRRHLKSQKRKKAERKARERGVVEVIKGADEESVSGNGPAGVGVNGGANGNGGRERDVEMGRPGGGL